MASRAWALLADYVGTEDGTGIVHNSPGHGADDYYVCVKEGMDICMPVDDDGKFHVRRRVWLRWSLQRHGYR